MNGPSSEKFLHEVVWRAARPELSCGRAEAMRGPDDVSRLITGFALACLHYRCAIAQRLSSGGERLGELGVGIRCPGRADADVQPRSARSTACNSVSGVNGFARTCRIPQLSSSCAVGMTSDPVTRSTGTCGASILQARPSARPLILGMISSVTTTSKAPRWNLSRPSAPSIAHTVNVHFSSSRAGRRARSRASPFTARIQSSKFARWECRARSMSRPSRRSAARDRRSRVAYRRTGARPRSSAPSPDDNLAP